MSMLEYLCKSSLTFNQKDIYLVVDKKYSAGQIIKDTLEALQSTSLNLTTIFIETPLLLKAISQIAQDRKHDDFLNSLLNDYNIDPAQLERDISLGLLNIFQGRYKAGAELIAGFPAILYNLPVVDETDNMSWVTSNPKYLERIIAQMSREDFKPDIIVPIAYGADRAGHVLAAAIGSDVLRVRYRKNHDDNDKTPIFIQSEDAIKKMVRGKRVLIYDEDSLTGNGVKVMATKLEKLGANIVKTAVSCVTNDTYSIEVDYVGGSPHLKFVSFDFDGVLHKSMIPGTLEPLGYNQASDFEPNYKMHEKLREYAQSGLVYIVTKRDVLDSPLLQEFVKLHHLPVRDIYFTNNKPKLPVLQQLNISKHYDDDKSMAGELRKAGIEFVYVNPFKGQFLKDLKWWLYYKKHRIEKRLYTLLHPGSVY